jgi:hypothetical protein
LHLNQLFAVPTQSQPSENPCETTLAKTSLDFDDRMVLIGKRYSKIHNNLFKSNRDRFLADFRRLEKRVRAVDFYNNQIAHPGYELVTLALSRPHDPSLMASLEAKWKQFERQKSRVSWFELRRQAIADNAPKKLVGTFKTIQSARLGVSTSLARKRSGAPIKNWADTDGWATDLAEEVYLENSAVPEGHIESLLSEANFRLRRGETGDQALFPGGDMVNSNYILHENDLPNNNSSGNETYVAGTRRELAMKELIVDWFEENKKSLYPIALAAGMYQRIASVHPYWNGNGRTARVIADMALMSAGYPPPILDPKAGRHVAVFSFKKLDENPTPDSVLELYTEGIETTFRKLGIADKP